MELLVTRHQTESLATLVVCALPQEAAHLGSGVLVTGPGKVRASVALTHALASQRPDQVIVCGTAGALDPSLHGVLEVGRVTEHDLDTTAISAVVGTDYGRTLQLSDSGHHLATGDQFISGHRAEALRERGFELVDMEGFAFAMAAHECGVPIRIVKAVSDTAEADALGSWRSNVDRCSHQLAAWLDQEGVMRA